MFKRFWWMFLAMGVIGPVSGLMLAATLSYAMPKKYESSAIIELKLIGSPASPPISSATELARIKTTAVFVKLSEHLELTKAWGMDQETVVKILDNIVTTGSIPGTDLISIRVRHTSREDARRIAAEIVKIYRDDLVERTHRENGRSLSELDQAIQAQEKIVKDRQKNFLAGTFSATPNLPTSDLVDQDAIHAKRDLETDQALLQELKLKQTVASVQSRIGNQNVEVHLEPENQQTPNSPNVTLNLVLGSALGLIISPLLALIGMFMLNQIFPTKEPRTLVSESL